ncbi:hypothetical protein MHM89_12550 [Pseudoalteromonas sp. CNC9-20]|uniref:hypothetical protein n=1 Tax=Pseudoalteromonas sp. CNC9-20 TaxID=2917750 RepID=UPI001EF5FC0C|nr:hypothetical protein [Pseudoalteromonas sp. CNC9-20]MCG7570767.1 hypothetical protein [Pseudoalteromonas sp. CNC9-20]
MKNKFIDFCALCFRTNKNGLSRYYCEQHQPKTNLYNLDRSKLKRISKDQFSKMTGHIEKIRFLSRELDTLSPSPSYLLEHTRKIRQNGMLSFEPAFRLIENEYGKAYMKLEKGSFSISFPSRWVLGYLVRLGYRNEEVQSIINEASDLDLFDIVVIVSARYEAYRRLQEHFPDRRKNKTEIQLSETERSKLMSLIKSTPLKPNGRICRKTLGEVMGTSRHKAGRLINKLKQNGDIDGDF